MRGAAVAQGRRPGSAPDCLLTPARHILAQVLRVRIGRGVEVLTPEDVDAALVAQRGAGAPSDDAGQEARLAPRHAVFEASIGSDGRQQHLRMLWHRGTAAQPLLALGLRRSKSDESLLWAREPSADRAEAAGAEAEECCLDGAGGSGGERRPRRVNTGRAIPPFTTAACPAAGRAVFRRGGFSQSMSDFNSAVDWAPTLTSPPRGLGETGSHRPQSAAGQRAAVSPLEHRHLVSKHERTKDAVMRKLERARRRLYITSGASATEGSEAAALVPNDTVTGAAMAEEEACSDSWSLDLAIGRMLEQHDSVRRCLSPP